MADPQPPVEIVPRAVAEAQRAAAAAGKALARRDWIMGVAERQRALSSRTGGIMSVTGLSSDQFLDHFYAPGRPVIIKGEMAGWPALGWTPAALKEKVGAAPITFQGGRTGNALFELHKDRHKQTAPFDAFIDAITAQDGNDLYLTAYNSDANRAALAPLQADIGPLDKYLTPGAGMLWIGPGGTFTPLHFDLTNNLLAQVVGRKRLVLLPPSETPRMANTRHVFSEVHDITDPQNLARHPEARATRRFVLELEPGDLLYIPVGWWHQVTSLEFSVMLTFTNFRWPNDPYASFPPD